MKIATFTQDVTLPASELLSPKEVKELNDYDLPNVRKHGKQAVSLQASRHLADAEAHLAAAFAMERRGAFAGYFDLHSKFALGQFVDESPDNSTQASKEAALNTPVLHVDQAPLRELAPPTHVLSKSNVDAYHR